MNNQKTTCINCNSENIQIEDDNIICLKCGFHTSKLYNDDIDIVNNDFDELTKNEKNKNNPLLNYYAGLPKIVKDLKIKDCETNQFWFPIILNIPGKGVLYPDGVSTVKWNWSYIPEIVIPIFERINYPIKERDNEYHETRLDMENAVQFDKLDFSNAVTKLGYK